MNESPLYFIIDQNLNISSHLYSMCPEQRKMFVYNIEYDDWNTLHIPWQVMKQSAAVHDHKRNRFFWIGGVESGEIIDNHWEKLEKKDQSFSFGGGRSEQQHRN